jgi:SagB-type dehydrogenase family enzyme
MSGLTVRVDADRVLASDDEGRTAMLPVEMGAELQDAFRLAAQPPSSPDVTAGTLAAIAEAQAARPQPRQAPPRAWQDHRDGPRVALANLTAQDSQPLAAVLAARRSRRDWMPPRLEDLASVLVRAGRVIDWAVAPDGYVTTRRPVPSAGARHPLDLHLLVADVHGLTPGAWRFDALRCELVGTALAHEPALDQLSEVLLAPAPPAALVAVAHLHRTLSRYPPGMSLLWRDAGALLGTLQLCATDVGLASCIAGTCGVLIDKAVEGILDVGALLLGAPA